MFGAFGGWVVDRLACVLRGEILPASNGAELRLISCLKVEGLKVQSLSCRTHGIGGNVRTKGLLTFMTAIARRATAG